MRKIKPETVYQCLILVFFFVISFSGSYFICSLLFPENQKVIQRISEGNTKDEFKIVEAISVPSGLPSTESSPSASPIPAPTAKPKPKFIFTTVMPGAVLPSGATCASRIVRSLFEPRTDNAQPNKTKGRSGVLVDGASEEWNVKFAGRIDGNFTGTTDEIIQWGACKWGFEVDLVRAVAAQESWWHMSTVGDNGESFGLMQVRAPVHEGTYPLSVQSTAFNVDYALAWRRACFEGTFTWMIAKNPSYKAGDEWGCVGAWFSGNWYDGDVNVSHSGANWYISKVKEYKNQRIWLSENFEY